MQTPANGPERQTDWTSVDWRAANRHVRNLGVFAYPLKKVH